MLQNKNWNINIENYYSIWRIYRKNNLLRNIFYKVKTKHVNRFHTNSKYNFRYIILFTVIQNPRIY